MTSPHARLANLQQIGQIKAEPPDQREFDGLVVSAERMLGDARNMALSSDSRFILAYDAAHSLALAALRWHGYRSESRYTVFQTLGDTASMPPERWRVLAHCHAKRNAALYEGAQGADERLIGELIEVTGALLVAINAFGKIPAKPA